MKEYPKNYNGPKAGQSVDEEWLAVREYDAFMYIIYGTWSYSDFDCWLVARDRNHYKLGGDSAVNALTEFQKRFNIKAEEKYPYE
jgi:hypothetical protein